MRWLKRLFCHKPMKDRMEMLGLGFIGIVEDAVIILTFGQIIPEFRAWYMFEFLEF